MSTDDPVDAYQRLRESFSMVPLTSGALLECTPSLQKHTAADVRKAFHRIAKRIIEDKMRIDRFDDRLTWWKVRDEIEHGGVPTGGVHEVHHAETALFRCPTCGKERRCLTWLKGFCRKCEKDMEIVPGTSMK